MICFIAFLHPPNSEILGELPLPYIPSRVYKLFPFFFKKRCFKAVVPKAQNLKSKCQNAEASAIIY